MEPGNKRMNYPLEETIQLDIIKKNRKYFRCKTINGDEAKLVIDEKTEKLKLGLGNFRVSCDPNQEMFNSPYKTPVIYRLVPRPFWE